MSMTFAKRRRARCTSIEWLESRALLSAVVGELTALQTKASDSLQVLELNRDDILSEAAQPTVFSSLPEAVKSAVWARLPGATILSAEQDEANGTVHFGVTAKRYAEELTITLSSDGSVLEIERLIATSSLPRAVQGWLSDRFPDSTILQAESMTSGRSETSQFQLTITTPSQPNVEALLLVMNSDSVMAPPVQNASAVRLHHNIETARVPQTVDPGTNIATDTMIKETQIAADRECASECLAESSAGFRSDGNSSEWSVLNGSRGSYLHRQKTESAEPNGIVLASMSTERRGAIAGVLTDDLPVDMETIEQAMREFLGSVGSLANKTVANGAAHRWIPSLVTTISALFCLERLVRDRKQAERSLAVFAGAKSSWSWVMKVSQFVHSCER